LGILRESSRVEWFTGDLTPATDDHGPERSRPAGSAASSRPPFGHTIQARVLSLSTDEC
jgi:hypothetical protein